jgi:hypothetical protein
MQWRAGGPSGQNGRRRAGGPAVHTAFTTRLSTFETAVRLRCVPGANRTGPIQADLTGGLDGFFFFERWRRKVVRREDRGITTAQLLPHFWGASRRRRKNDSCQSKDKPWPGSASFGAPFLARRGPGRNKSPRQDVNLNAEFLGWHLGAATELTRTREPPR